MGEGNFCSSAVHLHIALNAQRKRLLGAVGGDKSFPPISALDVRKAHTFANGHALRLSGRPYPHLSKNFNIECSQASACFIAET